MLTVDLVRARRKGKELVVTPLRGKARRRAAELADAYLGVTRAHIGCTRDELREACNQIEVGARERRLADGLLKLIDDACEFLAQSSIEPRALRSTVFLQAAGVRRGHPDGTPFDREAVLEAVAQELGVRAPEIEQSLYADLRGAHVLSRMEALDAERLLARYELAQIQAVLLRAVRVTADVICDSPAAYRRLFRRIKFRRLLHTITARPEGGYRVEIDGPYSIFDSVTKYGLQLALVLPALRECDALDLRAEVRWGKGGEHLMFRAEGIAPARAGSEPELPEEIQALAKAFRALDSPWSVAPASDILELPGVGLCVPDLVFQHERGVRVFLEVLGFWSREAVWRRVELVRAGLPERILFAASRRLRVREAVLDDEEHGALYVYKGTMSARAVQRKLNGLLDRRTPGGAPAKKP